MNIRISIYRILLIGYTAVRLYQVPTVFRTKSVVGSPIWKGPSPARGESRVRFTLDVVSAKMMFPVLIWIWYVCNAEMHIKGVDVGDLFRYVYHYIPTHMSEHGLYSDTNTYTVFNYLLEY